MALYEAQCWRRMAERLNREMEARMPKNDLMPSSPHATHKIEMRVGDRVRKDTADGDSMESEVAHIFPSASGLMHFYSYATGPAMVCCEWTVVARPAQKGDKLVGWNPGETIHAPPSHFMTMIRNAGPNYKVEGWRHADNLLPIHHPWPESTQIDAVVICPRAGGADTSYPNAHGFVPQPGFAVARGEECIAKGDECISIGSESISIGRETIGVGRATIGVGPGFLPNDVKAKVMVDLGLQRHPPIGDLIRAHMAEMDRNAADRGMPPMHIRMTEEALARMLFDTDPEVLQEAMHRGEVLPCPLHGDDYPATVSVADVPFGVCVCSIRRERLDNATAILWNQDGPRKRDAVQRAHLFVSKIYYTTR